MPKWFICFWGGHSFWQCKIYLALEGVFVHNLVGDYFHILVSSAYIFSPPLSTRVYQMLINVKQLMTRAQIQQPLWLLNRMMNKKICHSSNKKPIVSLTNFLKHKITSFSRSVFVDHHFLL
jgi:hypothetical protein